MEQVIFLNAVSGKLCGCITGYIKVKNDKIVSVHATVVFREQTRYFWMVFQ